MRKTRIYRILLVTCGVIVILLICGSVMAQFYYPDSRTYSTPTDYGLKYDDVFFKSEDGTKLHAWHIRTTASNRLGTIIHLHGNAQNMSSHIAGVDWLAKEGFDLFLFDYRGYGKSEGAPDRDGVFEDCVAAINEAVKLAPAEKNFILFGQSLGGANALAVAGSHKFKNLKGIVSEASFSTYEGVARDKVGGILSPLTNLVIDDSHSPLPEVGKIAPVPVLILHGTADQVVPYRHAVLLYEKAAEPKELWTIKGGQHMDTFGRHADVYRPKLVKHLKAWITVKNDKKK